MVLHPISQGEMWAQKVRKLPMVELGSKAGSVDSKIYAFQHCATRTLYFLGHHGCATHCAFQES